MRRKSTDFKTPNAGGWLNFTEALFLARYRGQPCEICGKRSGFADGKTTRSAGHHLLFQSQSRAHKFSHENIVVLCPNHHSQFNSDISPHSITSTGAQERFAEWLKMIKPEQYAWWKEHERDEYDKSVTARDMYEILGGEIKKVGPMKDWKPMNHRKNVVLTIEKYGGLLSKSEKEDLVKWRSKSK